MHCWSSCSRVIRPRYPHLYPHCYPHPPSPHQCWSACCRVMQSPPILTGTSWSARSRVIRYPHRYPHRHPRRPSSPVLVVGSPAPPPETRDGGRLFRCSKAERCSDCEGRGTAARLGGCRAFGGCRNFEVRATVRALRAAAARLSSSPPRWTFRWHYFSGNISVATLCVVASWSRRVVAASSSSSRRRRRVVVLVASSSSSPRRRRVIAVVVVVESSPRRVVAASCHPSPPLSSPPALTTSAGRRAVVCSPLSHSYLHPPPLTTSAGRCAVASILTAILSPQSSPPQPSPPHPPGPAPLPKTRGHAAAKLGAAATARAWGTAASLGLQRRLVRAGHCSEGVAAGSCSKCELRAAEGSSDCEASIPPPNPHHQCWSSRCVSIFRKVGIWAAVRGTWPLCEGSGE